MPVISITCEIVFTEDVKKIKGSKPTEMYLKVIEECETKIEKGETKESRFDVYHR